MLLGLKLTQRVDCLLLKWLILFLENQRKWSLSQGNLIQPASNGCRVKFGLILYVSMNVDDPIDFRSAAELAVQYKGKGVVGYGGKSILSKIT